MTLVCGWDCAPQVHSRGSNFNFDIRGGLFKYNLHISSGKVLAHLEFKSKVLPWPLNDLIACV